MDERSGDGADQAQGSEGHAHGVDGHSHPDVAADHRDGAEATSSPNSRPSGPGKSRAEGAGNCRAADIRRQASHFKVVRALPPAPAF